ncbi:hypothetical protein KM043_010930 [Ampulex compressa]|nr:hypothetical protein KM043_010930 [Ampulex compressa]
MGNNVKPGSAGEFGGREFEEWKPTGAPSPWANKEEEEVLEEEEQEKEKEEEVEEKEEGRLAEGNGRDLGKASVAAEIMYRTGIVVQRGVTIFILRRFLPSVKTTHRPCNKLYLAVARTAQTFAAAA